MEQKKESNFAEVQVDRLFMESFANEASAYYKTAQDIERDEQLEKYKSRLKWHMNHSLSRRQKQVMRLYLEGKRQRDLWALQHDQMLSAIAPDNNTFEVG